MRKVNRQNESFCDVEESLPGQANHIGLERVTQPLELRRKNNFDALNALRFDVILHRSTIASTAPIELEFSAHSPIH